jgi:hypothetical protein
VPDMISNYSTPFIAQKEADYLKKDNQRFEFKVVKNS